MQATAAPVRTPLRLRVASAVVAAGTIAAGTFAVTFGAGDRIDVVDPVPTSTISRYADIEAFKARSMRALGSRSQPTVAVSRLRDLELDKRHTMRALGMRADAE